MPIPYQPSTQKVWEQHEPVMTKEVNQFLSPTAGKIMVDCTLGFGGHTEAILSSPILLSTKGGEREVRREGARIIAFDQDAEALAAAKERLSSFNNISYIRDNFVNLKKYVKKKIDGVLFDLGVSSCQLAEASRGFSFQKDGPLDMRMDRSQKLTAHTIVNSYPPEEMEKIIKEYGEERFARRICHAIGKARRKKEIRTTFELKEIIEKAIHTWRKRESVARVFQALRIAVNSELENLKRALNDAVSILKPGGRIIVISYHSLEDRIVKHTFRNFAKDGILKILTKKPVSAGKEELKNNPRARSAKLRAAERR